MAARMARGLAILAAAGLFCLPLVARAVPWTDLSPMQQEALAPLSKTWNTLPDKRQQHLLTLAKHYPTLPPEKKDRFHKQLVPWSKLTPEQRERAREKYRVFSRIPQRQREEVRKRLLREQQEKNSASGVNPSATAIPVAPATAQ
jgi:hypothetical protein